MNKTKWFVALCLSVSLTAHAQSEATEHENAVPTEAGISAAPLGESRIDLRTQVTGNQEQPMVMYILPWQSPLSPELGLDTLAGNTEAVFGHIERDELRRNLDASGIWDKTH